MSKRLKNRWIAAGIVWVLVLGLTGWNMHQIDCIQTERRGLATLQMDQRFLKANQATIQGIRAHKARLNHVAESRDLGFLVVENNLKQLASDFGLHRLAVKVEKNEMSSRSIGISVDAEGSVPAVTEWVSALEKRYPYLEINRLEFADKTGSSIGQLRMKIDYRLLLSSPGPVI